MRVRTLRLLAVLTALAALQVSGAVPARAEEVPLNPHTREGCLHCHKGGVKGLGPGRTTIFSASDEPHAVVSGSCRACHKEGKQDFWLVILPSGSGRPAPEVSAAASGRTDADRPAPSAQPDTPGAMGGGEGFENSHDAMDCTGCHDKPADQLKPGGATPARFASQGVEAFCRSCHSGVDRSHFPRGNVPPPGTNCLSCHRTHGRSQLFPSLRDDFPQVVADSASLNPHGGRIFCLACHPDTPQPGAPIELRFTGNSLRLCQRCHAGVEHHPLGVTSTPATWKMDFSHTPLEKEAVVCISCHKPQECLGAVGRENPRFLRGGPFNTVEEFCRRCHEDKKFSTLNPHDQIDESGEVYQKKCLYCHVAVPNTSAGDEGLQFTDTLTALCISCHHVGPHPAQDHLQPMNKTMRATLRDYEERRMVRLPLEEGNRVTCVSCHNPHERGLLKGPAGIGADEENRLRLASFNEQCIPCHGRH